jgi:hypothetical protein
MKLSIYNFLRTKIKCKYLVENILLDYLIDTKINIVQNRMINMNTHYCEDDSEFIAKYNPKNIENRKLEIKKYADMINLDSNDLLDVYTGLYYNNKKEVACFRLINAINHWKLLLKFREKSGYYDDCDW